MLPARYDDDDDEGKKQGKTFGIKRKGIIFNQDYIRLHISLMIRQNLVIF